jgi:hypothetical protein
MTGAMIFYHPIRRRRRRAIRKVRRSVARAAFAPIQLIGDDDDSVAGGVIAACIMVFVGAGLWKARVVIAALVTVAAFGFAIWRWVVRPCMSAIRGSARH